MKTSDIICISGDITEEDNVSRANKKENSTEEWLLDEKEQLSYVKVTTPLGSNSNSKSNKADNKDGSTNTIQIIKN